MYVNNTLVTAEDIFEYLLISRQGITLSIKFIFDSFLIKPIPMNETCKYELIYREVILNIKVINVNCSF